MIGDGGLWSRKRGVAVDDEQGPWWTRPPEPGPQAPPAQRRQPSVQRNVEVDDPRTGPVSAEPSAGSAQSDRTVVNFVPPDYTRAEPQTDLGPEPEFEPEPERVPEPEPPPAPKPTVRRVAVVPPTPPPVRTADRAPRDARTEHLPPVSDDIFATFSGPPPVGARTATRASGNTHPQQSARRAPAGEQLGEPERPRPLALLSQVNLPEPRVLLLAAAGALVVLLIVVVALVSGRGREADKTARPPTAGPSAPAAANAFAGQEPDGLKQLTAAVATAELRKVDQGPGGTIVEAWSWTDKNGSNLVATSIDPAGANKRTLRVIHVAGLDDDPRTMRVMRDPNLPADCKGAGTAEFTPKSLIVRDLNSDNVAEVISGWTSRCGGKENESQIRLALITDGEKYILRGQGVLGSAREFTPAPRSARWPDNYFKLVSAQYAKLYG
jgi:hypothetical protein